MSYYRNYSNQQAPIGVENFQAFEKLSKETIVKGLIWETVMAKDLSIMPLRIRFLETILKSEIEKDNETKQKLENVEKQLDEEFGKDQFIDEEKQAKKIIEKSLRKFSILWDKVESKIAEEYEAEL